jgi:acetyl esterase/lipase
MKRYVVPGLLYASAAACLLPGFGLDFGQRFAGRALAGLVLEDMSPSPVEAAAAEKDLCEGVSISRRLRYGPSELNVLDVATQGHSGAANPRPVLLFVAGESFDGNSADADAARSGMDQAICFAARNDMVGVSMSYRLAPESTWPAAAKDVAAAVSWIRENIDLFGGNSGETVAIGYSVGAFHVATLLSHRELQNRDSTIAGLALVSGFYRPDPNPDAAEKAYFGSDASKYAERSVFPGILYVEAPTLLAWSIVDSPTVVRESEELRDMLCKSRGGSCPRTSILRSRENITSLSALGEPILELVREIEARGLP